jgi:hypothetical protein
MNHPDTLKLLRRVIAANSRLSSPTKIRADLAPTLATLVQNLPHAQTLLGLGWRMFVVEQKRGWCRYGDKVITIPAWSITKPKGPGYPLYYLAHECAHALADTLPGKRQGSHDMLFMRMFMTICPVALQHYEHGYKPQMARAAGVPRPPANLLSQELPKSMTSAALLGKVTPAHRKMPGATLSAQDVLTALQEQSGPMTIAQLAEYKGWQPIRVHGAFLALKAQGKITYSNKTATLV